MRSGPENGLVAHGSYVLGERALENRCPPLIIRGASGNRDAVIVRGAYDGPSAWVGNVILVATNNAVIADVTLDHCRYHGI